MEQNQIIIYQTPNGETAIDVKIENETIWLSQSQITTLFKRDRTVITKHINNIFSEKELDERSNVQKMHITNSDRPVAFYSLDVIISIGNRVNKLLQNTAQLFLLKKQEKY